MPDGTYVVGSQCRCDACAMRAYCTDEYEGVMVHRPGLAPLHFLPSRRGLYYYDATPMALNTTNHSVNAYSYNFVTTVARNLEMFTRMQRQKIADAKRLYELL
eukprot:scaffold2039_cov113-Cylindrotheca_fusiformis.AAC.1